jgi:CubicO group peptidase (beta-lactamase class C family)
MRKLIIGLWLFWIGAAAAVGATYLLPSGATAPTVRTGQEAAIIQSPAEPPAALEDVTIVAVDHAWRSWMTDEKITESAMALGVGGKVLHGAGEIRNASAPYPVASLSKAITAICANSLLEEHGISWSATLGDVKDAMSAARVTPPNAVLDISLAQLATHTAGLKPDLTQGEMLSDKHGTLGRHNRISLQALRPEGTKGKRGQYFYSNTNYTVLGSLIEGLAGASYAPTCMDRVMVPASATGAVSEGAMGSMSSYAGWEVSAEDYARFAMYWFAPDRPWVTTPDAYPSARAGKTQYGLGMSHWGTGKDAVFTHSGRLTSDTPSKNSGALVVITGKGEVFAANWQGRLKPAQYDHLVKKVLDALR